MQWTGFILVGGLLGAGSSLYVQANEIHPLEIPKSIARITETSAQQVTQLPDIILIQDIHKHPEAQRHIAEVIERFHAAWGIQSVYLEGAFSDVTPVGCQEGESSMEGGHLTGAEWAACQIGSDLHLYGLEDPTLYRLNLIAYHQARRAQEIGLKEWLPNEQLQSLLSLRMTPSSYALFEQQKNAVENVSWLHNAGIEAAERFYELALARNNVFIDRLVNSLITGPKIVVLGGFHTADLLEKLRQHQKSYVVLSPTVTYAADPDLYAKRLDESISTLLVRN